MKRKKSPLAFAYLVFLIVGAVFFAYRGFTLEKPAPPSPATWSSFEKRVLLNLDTLEKTKAAEAFFSELNSNQDLRRAIESGPSESDRVRFKRLVSLFADDPDFRAAVENPEAAAEAAPCDSPEPAKPLWTETADPLSAPEPGCAETSPPIGRQRTDLLIPKPTD